VESSWKDDLRKIIAQIVEDAERTGATLSIAQEANRLAVRFPGVSKRLICDMLIAAGLKEELPIEMMDTEESCRDGASKAA
jgi:hypothetical protein